MAEVTREMVLEYMQARGGVVKNVDLVRHFRKYLQLSDQRAKGVYVCVRSRIRLSCLFSGARDFPGLSKTTLGASRERVLSFGELQNESH